MVGSWARSAQMRGGYCFCLATHSGFAHSASGHTVSWFLLVAHSARYWSAHHTWQTRFFNMPSVKHWYMGALFLGRTSTYLLLVTLVGVRRVELAIPGSAVKSFTTYTGRWAKSPRYWVRYRFRFPRHWIKYRFRSPRHWVQYRFRSPHHWFNIGSDPLATEFDIGSDPLTTE